MSFAILLVEELIDNEQFGGRFTYLMDCSADIPKDKDFLWHLLQQKKILAMNPIPAPRGGVGLVKMELCEDEIYENNRQIDMVRFEELRDTMCNFIVTEYAHQHHVLAAIWPASEYTPCDHVQGSYEG